MFRLPSTPNPFTAARILVLPILWAFALINWQPALGIGLALAALTDVLDGRLAKKYPQFADTRFDSLADKLLTFSVIAWVIILKHQLITEHWMLLLSAAIIYSVSLFIGWRKHGHITTLHTYLGKVGGLVQAIFVVHAFLTTSYSVMLFYFAIALFILAAVEELFIQLVYAEIDEEVVHSIIPYLRNREVTKGAKKILNMRFLSHPRYPLILFIIALLLVSPSLFVGLQFDDYLQRTVILKSSNSLPVVLKTLFIFMDGNPIHAQAKIESGAFPWYTLPQGQVAFWRPLSAFTHWLDYQLWPMSPLLMHVQSLVWFACLIWVVIVLYCQFFDQPRLVYLAATLYLLDDARGFAVGWLSNRNAIIAAVFGFAALIFHSRWRRDNWRTGLFLSPLFFALSLLSGESALAVVAYLLAFALFLDPTSRLRRFLSLTPYVVILLLWRVAYSAQGFGAWGTSYIEPTREPLRFLQAVIGRVPILLLGQWAFPPAELFSQLTPPTTLIYWVIAVVALCLIMWICLSLRRSPLAQFFALGSLLAVIPPSASLPANRLLFFIGLGAFGLLALLADLVKRPRLVQYLLVFHFFLSPLLLPLTSFSPALYSNIEPSLVSLPSDRSFATQTAIFVNAPSHFHVGYLPDIRSLTGQTEPARLRFFAPGLTSITYTRVDSHTLIVQPKGGYLSGFEAVFRDPAHPFDSGQTITLSDMQIEILSLTPDQRPAAVAFHFNFPLENPSYRWFQWSEGRYIAFTLPPVHATIILPYTLDLFTSFTVK